MNLIEFKSTIIYETIKKKHIHSHEHIHAYI
jgi:hypothetical protein